MDHIQQVRLEHMLEIIDTIQGKNSMDVPARVIQSIKVSLESALCFEPTVEDVMLILRDQRQVQYYGQASMILYRITDKPPYQVPDEVQDEFIEKFKRVMYAWEIRKPPERHSLPSLSCIAYQLWKLLNVNELLSLLSLYRSSEKNKSFNEIWQGICDELQWSYYPLPLSHKKQFCPVQKHVL